MTIKQLDPPLLTRPSESGLAEPPNRRPAPVGLADRDRADRRHAEGWHLPPHFDRSRSKGARLVQGAVRGARLQRDRRRHGQYVRAPAGQEPGASPDRHGLASRHPADRRQIRRRAWRARRAPSAAHAARGGLRDQRPDRDRQLDQRRRRALCAGDAGLRRFRRRVLRDYAYARTAATAKPSARNWRASGYRGAEKAGARTFAAMFELHIEQGPDPRSRKPHDRHRARRPRYALV